MESVEDWRLGQLRQICLALPGAACDCVGTHARFSVKKKTFAYFLNDHHGDGIVAVTCKVLPGDNARLVTASPAKFYLPAYLAAKGWVALRLDGAEVDWEEVGELLAGSYRQVAGSPRKAHTRFGKSTAPANL